MNATRTLLCAATLALFAGCASETPPAETPAPDTTATASSAEPTFVDRTWEVVASQQIPAGAFYTFRSDGMLSISSPNSTPLLGSWARTDSGLTMTEEGITYRVEILELTQDRFRIRSLNPGEPVEITFAPAPTN